MKKVANTDPIDFFFNFKNPVKELETWSKFRELAAQEWVEPARQAEHGHVHACHCSTWVAWGKENGWALPAFNQPKSTSSNSIKRPCLKEVRLGAAVEAAQLPSLAYTDVPTPTLGYMDLYHTHEHMHVHTYTHKNTHEINTIGLFLQVET